MSASTTSQTESVDRIVRTAYVRCGLVGRSRDAGLIKRGRDELIPEIMADFLAFARERQGDGTMVTLETSALMVMTPYQQKYAVPDDFDVPSSAVLYAGTEGTAQAGSANTITLASDAASPSLGQLLIVKSGNAMGDCRQIIAYDSTTKVVTVEAQWSNDKTPESGDSYLVVDQHDELDHETSYDARDLTVAASPGRPQAYYVYNREVRYDRPPDDDYVVEVRYKADPYKVSYSDPKWGTIIERYRGMLVKGLQRFILEEIDDRRAEQVRDELYEVIFPSYIGREGVTGDEPTCFVIGDMSYG